MALPLNKKLKIAGLYFLSIIMLLAYVYMKGSTELSTFLEQADHVGPDTGFGFYFLVALIQYILLISGISLPIILSIMLIRRRDKDMS